MLIFFDLAAFYVKGNIRNKHILPGSYSAKMEIKQKYDWHVKGQDKRVTTSDVLL